MESKDSTNDPDLNLNKFRTLFWDAFQVPPLESEKYLKVFKELETLNDLIAGPLFSIYENGNCDYIFQAEGRFKGVNTADQYFEWIVNAIKEYAEKATAPKPENEKEENDLKMILFQADVKMELAELSYEIVKKLKV